MANRRGNRCDANFTEDVVALAVESYLSCIDFPRQRFSVVPVSRQKERWLGADARLYGSMKGFQPFYMQFKRPSAYPDFSRSRIIKNRRNLSLETSPNVLFFKLQPKKLNHRDFQHNVLFRLRNILLQWGMGDAVYVCPLFVDRASYRDALQWSGLKMWLRFWDHDPRVLRDIGLRDGAQLLNFSRIPSFPEHVSIPPHKRISSANHKYSFTDSATDLCFHSPESLPEGMETLDVQLARIVTSFMEGQDRIQVDQATEYLSNLLRAISDDQDEKWSFRIDKSLGPIGNWFNWGDFLTRTYGIQQFALVEWGD